MGGVKMKTLQDVAQYIEEILSQGIEILPDSPVHLALKKALQREDATIKSIRNAFAYYKMNDGTMFPPGNSIDRDKAEDMLAELLSVSSSGYGSTYEWHIYATSNDEGSE